MFEGYRKGDGYDGHLATDAVGLVKRIPLQLGVFQTNRGSVFGHIPRMPMLSGEAPGFDLEKGRLCCKQHILILKGCCEEKN